VSASSGRGWRARLFPDPPRRIPQSRSLNIALRTIHLVTFAVLLGGHVWGVEEQRLLPSLWLTVGSGVGLMALEVATTGRWVFEASGLLVVAKLALLLAVPLFWESRVALLLAVVVLAAVGSHMPRRWRHACPLGVPRAVAERPTSDGGAGESFRGPESSGRRERP
jgi:hypothetical protein